MGLLARFPGHNGGGGGGRKTYHLRLLLVFKFLIQLANTQRSLMAGHPSRVGANREHWAPRDTARAMSVSMVAAVTDHFSRARDGRVVDAEVHANAAQAALGVSHRHWRRGQGSSRSCGRCGSVSLMLDACVYSRRGRKGVWGWLQPRREWRLRSGRAGVRRVIGA